VAQSPTRWGVPSREERATRKEKGVITGIGKRNHVGGTGPLEKRFKWRERTSCPAEEKITFAEGGGCFPMQRSSIEGGTLRKKVTVREGKGPVYKGDSVGKVFAKLKEKGEGNRRMK